MRRIFIVIGMTIGFVLTNRMSIKLKRHKMEESQGKTGNHESSVHERLKDIESDAKFRTLTSFLFSAIALLTSVALADLSLPFQTFSRIFWAVMFFILIMYVFAFARITRHHKHSTWSVILAAIGVLVILLLSVFLEKFTMTIFLFGIEFTVAAIILVLSLVLTELGVLILKSVHKPYKNEYK